MKSQNLALGAIVLIAVAGLAYWLLNPPAPAPVQVAAKPAPATATPTPPPIEVKAPRVAMPIAAPAPTPAEPAASTPAQTAPAETAKGDPQAELSTAIPEIIGFLQAGDMVSLMERYMPPDEIAKMPPEQLAQMRQQMQTEMQNPQFQQMMQGMVQVFQSMKDQTPTYNAAGDVATYQINMPAVAGVPSGDFPSKISFKKINGKWYGDDQNGDGF
jgi:hypothetical protein